MLSKAECEIPTTTPVSKVPPAVLTRCFGKQTPVAPHAQRLLAAARRESNVPTKGKAKAKAKAKASAKGSGKGKGKGKDKKANGNNSEGKSPKDPKEKSPYALAKIAYFEQLYLV